MAGHGLIEPYLAALEGALHARPDRDDLAAELRDHLEEAVERLQASGYDTDVAERAALARFGDAESTAALLCAVPPKEDAMSAFLTRLALPFAIVAAAAFLIAAASLPLGLGDQFGWSQAAYLSYSIASAIGVLATGAVLLGVNYTAAGKRDVLGTATLVAVILAAVLAILLGWMWALWMTVLAFAVVVTMARAWTAHVAGRFGSITLLLVWPAMLLVGTTIAAVFSASEPAIPAQYDWAQLIVLVSLNLVLAVGVLVTGIHAHSSTASSRAPQLAV
jgi:lysylphosphatidylglycerol synthetase-like protein (DUF2156 family)